jgi:hypothetical protein
MKPVVLGVAMLVLGALQNPLPAQDEPKLETGASISITLSRFAGSGAQDPRVQYGFGVGGFLTFRLTRHIALQPELLFVQKGARFQSESTRSSLALGYLELPVLVKLQFPPANPNGVTPRFYGGVAGSYRIDCRLNVKTGNSSVSQSCSNLAEPPPKSWDASVVAGGGVDFRVLFVDLRFDLGLTRIGSTAGQEDIKNRTLFLMIGTAFRAP